MIGIRALRNDIFKNIKENINKGFFFQYIHNYSTQNEISKKPKKDYILSLDEALYLSKELGIKTTTEIQRIIMRSPPFSPDTSPFVIENFFSSEGQENGSEELSQIDKKIMELETTKQEKEEDELNQGDFYSNNIKINECANKYNDSIINKILIDNFNKKRVKTFWHDNNEWLEESEGIGTNKRSCAYVYIKRGSGIIKINGNEDLYIRWPYFYNRMDVLEPFYVTNTACVFDVFIKLKGGGISGQSKAARLAVGRALLNACPHIYNELKQHDILYEDMRQKFPKMPGRKKSRAMKQWSKR
ncbi:mitochondrial ribosomal protein S9 precursor, putative [Plasmodium sp. gorilla clade G2]|uniref:mitochondrial ribosomal protein S9 precursor, putative n=1 Tax=Plasmodium sp. gorilla clade G2 TaxID=880535 RepID=UPI000D22B3ED|nr:mitochondrial ribosomal protein S9 precursor, putative [Plasmodium sp. gorilla clade G2]SOV15949.1 mitochondrial ribosomal protein S9 precursor, putative [Plasmodium sp. gorilla clade G2]